MKSYCHLIIFLLLVFGSGRIYAQNDSFTPVLPTEPEGVFTPDLPAEPNAEEDPFTPDLPAEPQVSVFTVSFVGFGGVSLGEQTVIQGQSANAPNAPKVTGYTFTVWDTDFSDVQSDLTVTAIYEKDIVYFNVTFVGFNNADLGTQKVEEGKSADAPDAPKVDGYTFIGWDTDFSDVQSDLTVTAIYEKDIVYFTVTFIGYNGADLGTRRVEQGKSAEAPDAPKVTGYTFKGWDTDFSDVQSDLTVRGIYVKIPEPEDGKFVVVFVDYDGTELSVQYVEPGRSAVPPQKPSRSGYLFYRWSGDYVNVRANSVVVATYVEIKTDDSQKKYVVFPCE